MPERRILTRDLDLPFNEHGTMVHMPAGDEVEVLVYFTDEDGMPAEAQIYHRAGGLHRVPIDAIRPTDTGENE